MFSIGEFSRITGLTVKTLRFYHEQGVLKPSRVESGSGYRYYDHDKVETAHVIKTLRELEFSLAEIKEILSSYDDDSDLVSFFESRKSEIQRRMQDDRRMIKMLGEVIQREIEVSEKMANESYSVEEKTLEPLLVASVRMQGKYSDCGTGFSKIGRKFGRFICGKSMLLHHDSEYREDDANFDVVMPIKKGESVDDIVVSELPGGRCLSLMHLGPYEELRHSYAKIMDHANEQGITYSTPTREVYHKGPGMIFKGNPKKYLTEIQLMIDE